jgi:hypothetical protein
LRRLRFWLNGFGQVVGHVVGPGSHERLHHETDSGRGACNSHDTVWLVETCSTAVAIAMRIFCESWTVGYSSKLVRACFWSLRQRILCETVSQTPKLGGHTGTWVPRLTAKFWPGQTHDVANTCAAPATQPRLSAYQNRALARGHEIDSSFCNSLIVGARSGLIGSSWQATRG